MNLFIYMKMKRKREKKVRSMVKKNVLCVVERKVGSKYLYMREKVGSRISELCAVDNHKIRFLN